MTTLSSKQQQQQPPRRTEEELRNEHLSKGALLLRFSFKDQSINRRLLQLWSTIEKKGFLVTSDGCLIPHQTHWFSDGARIVASTIACEISHGRLPDRSTLDTKNEHGWPEDEEISHLCHYSSCCNPDHLVIESKWRNLKRNYCGFNGQCDCMMVPPCVRTYHNSSFDHQFEFLKYQDAALSKKLDDLFSSFAMKIELLPTTYFRVEDEKRRNKLLRRKRQRRHDKEHLHHVAKRQRKMVEEKK